MAEEELVRVNFLVSRRERDLFQKAAAKADLDVSKALRKLVRGFIRRYQKGDFASTVVHEKEEGRMGDGSVKDDLKLMEGPIDE